MRFVASGYCCHAGCVDHGPRLWAYVPATCHRHRVQHRVLCGSIETDKVHMQGVAKYGLKSLLVLLKSSTCFDDAVAEGMPKTLDAVADIVVRSAELSDNQQPQLQRLQLCAVQV